MKKQLVLWSLLICICTIGNAQEIIEFTDVNFKDALLNYSPIIDTDGDNEISIEEAEAVITLNLLNKNLIDLNGIEKFINLTRLYTYNTQLTSVDISNNTNLTYLRLQSSHLTDIDISENINLSYLHLGSNRITDIDISNNLNLTTFRVDSNNLTEVDVSNNIKLTTILLSDNNLTNIDVSKNISLRNLYLSNNEFSNIDISENIALTTFIIGNNNLTQVNLFNNVNLSILTLYNNNLTEIDLSNNTNLHYLNLYSNSFTEIDLTNHVNLSILDINDNDLTTLDLRNCVLTEIDFRNNPNLQTVFMTNQPISRVDLNNCPNLEFICADQQYLNDIYSLLEDANQTTVQLSDDCDTPHNRIRGSITYDLDDDGCGNDIPFTGGVTVRAFESGGAFQIVTAFPNDQGQYAIHVADGNYSLIPSLSNNNYFEFTNPVSPPVFDPTNPLNPFGGTAIPADLADLSTDYCIQPVGDFNDLEVAIYPTDIASPGFTANYIISYQNNGTTTQSGSITLDYQEDVLEYISAVPAATSNIDGQLSWDFANLLPFEQIQIPFTLELNRPTDTSALVGGEILDFVATVSRAADETPEDNVMNLAQTVVNSYDPNDKTCLEGDILDPDDVGGYLHYMIRFENEGTANARFISVIDVIDTDKLDIETLVPLSASHSYTTTITNENEVEFFFEDINLPFDDANNDGYVIFKIKSLETLVEGDEIVNSAAIYFDFNLPVITEDSVVKVERPEEPTAPQFSDYFTLSPNPTTGILNLGVLDDSIAITYILLYDLNGDFVGFYDGTVRTMDVGYLFSRTYIMQIVTDKGDFSTQFIKL